MNLATTGLDTLKLSLSDYEISDNPDLHLDHATTNLKTGESPANYLLWRGVEGRRAYHNADTFNVTVQPIAAVPGAVSTIVQFSVPRVVSGGGSNYHPANAEQTRQAVDVVEAELRNVGIKTNLKTALMSRLDAAKTIQAAEPFPAYGPVLSAASQQRGKRLHSRDYGGSAFLLLNGVEEIGAYDKILEMLSRKQSIAGFYPNSIRFEHRNKGSRKVQRALGMKTVSDLLGDFGHVGVVYREAMRKNLFRHTVEDVLVLSEEELVEQMEFFRDRGEKQWFQKWLNVRAMLTLAADFDVVVAAAVKVANNREHARLIRNRLAQVRIDALALQPSLSKQKTMAQLYSELQEKVLV